MGGDNVEGFCDSVNFFDLLKSYAITKELSSDTYPSIIRSVIDLLSEAMDGVWKDERNG